MIPRTFPSTYASNGQQQMVVYFLPSITGLQRWLDYIPVKLSQGGVENSYNNNGYIDVTVVSRPTAAQQAWKEYIPAYLDDAATDAWRVNATGYIPYGYALFGGASMIMDMTNTGALDPRITFSRTSNATQFDSAGAVAYAPHNLLTFSESFDNGTWVKAGATVTANNTAAPNDSVTSDKLVETAANSEHITYQSFTFSAISYTNSVYAKAGERTVLYVWIQSPTRTGAFFNLGNGTTSNVASGVVATIVDVGNGWYRCSITFTPSAGAGFAGYQLVRGVSTVYAGDGTSGLFLWGAQLNVGALQPYYPTTVKNLLGFTQEFNNAAWTKAAATVTANATAAPDGSVTADKLVENAANAYHYVLQSSTTTANAPLTYSVYAKAAERNFINVQLGSSFTNQGVSVNLTTGQKLEYNSPTSTSVTDVGNGWWRISISASTSGTAPAVLILPCSTLSNNPIYTGDGTSGIFIWGAQLSDSASLDPYVYNPAAAFTSTAYYGPRFDYDPVTLAPRGLLIEEQRTNSIRNNTMVGAVAGTPGTLPTNWAEVGGGIGTLTRQIVGTGTENGVTYIDVKLSGTTSTVSVGYAFEAIGGIVASNGQTWTNSFWCKIVAGSTTNITSVNSLIEERTGAGGFLANTVSVVSPSNTLSRFTQTFTLNAGATVGQVRGAFLVLFSSGVAIDITLRIGLPQLEQGAFATSVIPTTTAAATRAADVATMVGDNFSNWYNQTEGSFYVESQTLTTSGNAFALQASDNSYNNRIVVAQNSTDSVGQVIVSGSVTLSPTLNPLRSGTRIRQAFGFATNSAQLATNGVQSTQDTSGAMVSGLTQLNFGSDHAGFNRLNGWVGRVAYFTTRLPNAQLQALTV